MERTSLDAETTPALRSDIPPWGSGITGVRGPQSFRRRAWEHEARNERVTVALDSGRIPALRDIGGGRHVSQRSVARSTWGAKMGRGLSRDVSDPYLTYARFDTAPRGRSLSFESRSSRRSRTSRTSGLASAALPQIAAELASSAGYTGEFDGPDGTESGRSAVVLTAARPQLHAIPMPAQVQPMASLQPLLQAAAETHNSLMSQPATGTHVVAQAQVPLRPMSPHVGSGTVALPGGGQVEYTTSPTGMLEYQLSVRATPER